MIFLGIIVSIILFSIIVIVHEYGHYKTAKIFGIHVEEFGLGIPPRAKKLWKNKDGTLFSLNWIPLGGFVKITGENEVHLQYFTKKGKQLSLKQLQKSLVSSEEIYDIQGNSLSEIEKKYLKEYLKNYKLGQNFFEKNIWQKSLVLLAGVIMNFFLAAVIFSMMFAAGVKPIGINTFIPTNLPSKLIPTLERSLEEGIILQESGVLLAPIEDSPAALAGIMQGDILISVNGEIFSKIPDLQAYISTQANTILNFSLQRIPENCDSPCKTRETLEFPIQVSAEGKIGTYLAPNYQMNQDFEYKYSLASSIKYGFLETYYQARLTFAGLGILIKNIFAPEVPEDREEALNQVAGPIGIVGVITSALAGGFSLLILLGAVISVNLGVFNLLPIPALDGGRLLLLWFRTGLEKIFGKRTVFTNIENSIHVFFFLTLILLSVLIAYNDVINISSR